MFMFSSADTSAAGIIIAVARNEYHQIIMALESECGIHAGAEGWVQVVRISCQGAWIQGSRLIWGLCWIPGPLSGSLTTKCVCLRVVHRG